MVSAADVAPASGDAVRPVREAVVERVPAESDRTLAVIRLIEALVWPVAFVSVALIFRAPVTALLTALARKLGA